NIAYLFAGLYLTCRLLTRFFGTGIALLSTMGVWLCSWMLHYSRPALNSEAPGMFAATLVLLLMSRWESSWPVSDSEPPPKKDLSLFLMGVAGGVAGMIRYQNPTLLIIPFAFMALQAWKRPAELRRIAALGLGVFVGFVPQLIAWKMTHGSSFQDPAEAFLP